MVSLKQVGNLPLIIQICRLRIRSDEQIGIMALKLVGFLVIQLKITYPKVRSTSLEGIAESDGGKGHEASSTATHDHKHVLIDQTLLDHVEGSIGAVVNINNAPVLAETITVLAPIVGRAAIIDRQYCNASRGKVVDRPIEIQLVGIRGAAIHENA